MKYQSIRNKNWKLYMYICIQERIHILEVHFKRYEALMGLSFHQKKVYWKNKKRRVNNFGGELDLTQNQGRA